MPQESADNANESLPGETAAPPPPESGILKKILLGLLVLTVLCGIIVGRPFLRWVRNARSRHFAGQSELYLAQENWQEAYSKAQAAYRLSPQEPAAWRALAHFYEKADSRAATPFLKMLCATPAATTEDEKEYAEVSLQHGDALQAHDQITRVLQRDGKNPEHLRLAARIYGALGDLKEARHFALQAEEFDPGNMRGRFLTAEIEISSSDQAERAKGWEAIWKLDQDQTEAGLDCLRFCSRRPAFPREHLAALPDLLRHHPLATERDRLLASELDLLRSPSEREQILRQAMADLKKGDGAALHTLAVWLNTLGEFKKTTEILPEALAVTRQDLFLTYLDAMAAMNRWKDVDRLLEMKDVPLADVYVQAFHAKSAEARGDKETAEFSWRRAHTAATGNMAQMAYLAQYAEKSGRIDQAELAYRSLADDVPSAQNAYHALLRIAQGRKDAQATLTLLQEMASRWRDDPAVRNDVAYMSLLLKKEVPKARDIALGLVSALPSELPHRTALALACLRTNDPASALNTYAGLQIPWEKVAARDKAIYVAVLGANGREEEAKKMAASLATNDLFPEELDLVRPWLSHS